jgi:sugar lactone lactonase YvrE
MNGHNRPMHDILEVPAHLNSTPWQAISADRFVLGESPFWHPHEQTLYWVDIAGKKVCRANVYMGTVQSWDMPSEPGCIAPATKGGLVIALRHGIFRAKDWGGSLQHITTLPYDTATVRANDGKCDAQGRFWVGTIDEPKAHKAAALYSIDCASGSPHVQRHASDALTGNGLAWSPDGRTLYWADTPTHVVHAWDFDVVANTNTRHRKHIQMHPKPAGWAFGQTGYGGRPDGAAVDVEGNYYSAMYEGACVCKFAPDGTLLAEFPVPAACPTMPCFGGEDLKTLYLTTASGGRGERELSQLPLSGAVLFMRVDTPGMPVQFFSD